MVIEKTSKNNIRKSIIPLLNSSSSRAQNEAWWHADQSARLAVQRRNRIDRFRDIMRIGRNNNHRRRGRYSIEHGPVFSISH